MQPAFIGKVKYEKERALRDFVYNNGQLKISPECFARSLLLKRWAFKHESEIRLLYFGDARNYSGGLYRYAINTHDLITQIMADPRQLVDLDISLSLDIYPANEQAAST